MSSQSRHRLSSSMEQAPRSSKALKHLYAKQRRRQIPTSTLPCPSLDVSLDDYASFVACLKSSTRVLALLGAGLSAASGVPTFRGAGGFWREHNATDLATPEAFERDPSLVWQFYNHRRHNALRAKPNRAHAALGKLAGKKDFLAISQNIDDLSQRAGHCPESLISLHGSLFEIKCSNPRCEYTSTNDSSDPIVPALALSETCDISDVRFPIRSIPSSSLPTCPQCASLLRPDIVWFGEPVPFPTRERIHSWLDKGPVDLMLVIGTSTVVWPAAIYIHSARVAGARIAVFNTEEPNPNDDSQMLREQDWFFRGDAGAIVPDVLKEVVGVVPEIKR